MAKFTLRTDNNLSSFSHHRNYQTLTFNTSFRNPPHLNIALPSKHRLKFNFSCSIKEKERENVADTDRVLAGLRVDDKLNKNGSPILDSQDRRDAGIGSVNVGFDLNWPPWKNVPQRYKLIGTTSAFVICSMDKVNLSIAIIPMSHQFGWNSSVAGLVQSSLFWGYALSQLPRGWLAKVFGGRIVLQFGVLAWSLATTCVPLLAGFIPGSVFSRILIFQAFTLFN